MNSCKKPCKECPWINENSHSLKFRTYVDKMNKLGKIENHKCHMVSNDVWGYKSEVNSKNVCIGSKQRNKN
jgi:hypothetical protein